LPVLEALSEVLASWRRVVDLEESWMRESLVLLTSEDYLYLLLISILYS
jgi:hypothetical protein